MQFTRLWVGVVLGGTTLMAGCGSIQSLLPDRSVSNPLRLQGTSHGLVVTGSNATLDATAGPFANIGDLPLNPRNLKVDQALSTPVVLTGSSVTPTSITLTNIALAITVRDQNGTFAVLTPSVIPGPVTLTHTGGSNYAITGTPPDFPTIETGGKTGQVLSILTGGGTNTVSTTFSATVNSSPAITNGSVLTFTFGQQDGTLVF